MHAPRHAYFTFKLIPLTFLKVINRVRVVTKPVRDLAKEHALKTRVQHLTHANKLLRDKLYR